MSIFCSMAHGGLHLVVLPDRAEVQNCCLHNDYTVTNVSVPFWYDNSLTKLRQKHEMGIIDGTCQRNCLNLEKSGIVSFRQGMNSGLQIPDNITGPLRIDLKFDVGCNLACRTCGPMHSSYWQKYLIEHDLAQPSSITTVDTNKVIAALSNLDLSNLQMLVFCGGETLMGTAYWRVAEWLADAVPNAKQQLTLAFQTNGTMPIPSKYFDLIEKFHLIKLHVSVDAVDKRFEYLRWPAKWDQVVTNVINLRDTIPSNVMFLIEETLSVFNLPYLGEVFAATQEFCPTNRDGDTTLVTQHVAGGIFGLQNLTNEYVLYLESQQLSNFVPAGWVENRDSIIDMVSKIQLHDRLRGQSWSETFPVSAQFYSKYL